MGVWAAIIHTHCHRGPRVSVAVLAGAAPVGGAREELRQLDSVKSEICVQLSVAKAAGGPWWLCWPLVSSVVKVVLCSCALRFVAGFSVIKATDVL